MRSVCIRKSIFALISIFAIVIVFGIVGDGVETPLYPKDSESSIGSWHCILCRSDHWIYSANVFSLGICQLVDGQRLIRYTICL